MLPEHRAAILQTLTALSAGAARSLAATHRGAIPAVRRDGALVTAHPGPADLLSSNLGLTLQDIAAVADGTDRAPPPGRLAADIQAVCEACHAPASGGDYRIPADWWRSGVGRICRLAQSGAGGDADLMTIAAAAAALGVTTQAVSNALRAGKLRAMPSAGSDQPARGTRTRLVYRDEVEKWKEAREGIRHDPH